MPVYIPLDYGMLAEEKAKDTLPSPLTQLTSYKAVRETSHGTLFYTDYSTLYYHNKHPTSNFGQLPLLGRRCNCKNSF